MSDPTLGRERVARLREWLAAKGLDGFIVPRADEHQGEYVPARSERLTLADRFFRLGRRRHRARQTAPSSSSTAATRCRCATRPTRKIFTIESLIDNPPPKWIKANLGKGARLGFDPWLHTIGDVKALT